MYKLLSIFIITAAATLPLVVTTDEVEIQFSPRSPEQLMSFYEARGFPAEMIDILKQQCFITVRIHNKRKEKVWHDLANWVFTHDGKPLRREHRNVWLNKWRSMDMPQASISTFRWTLLPETLDYLPDEQEGGNIILPRVSGPIRVTASFPTGEDKQGPVINIDFDQLYCADNVEE